MKIKDIWRMAAPAAILSGILMITGCDWSSGGGADDFTVDESIQVSGVYRAPNSGDPIVTDYTSRSRPATTNETLESVSGQRIGEGNGIATAFSGSLGRSDITPGTLIITVPPGYTFSDNGDGSLTGSPGGSGSISYASGGWSIDLGGVAPAAGADIRASYEYTATSVNEEENLSSGASATTIYTFTIQQSGNRFTMVDNNGDSYSGNITSSETINSVVRSDGTEELEQVAQFTAKGTSRGIRVEIVGSFNIEQTVFFSQEIQDNANLTLEETFRTISLSMEGTWLEDNGSTGDIRAIGPQNQTVELFSEIF